MNIRSITSGLFAAALCSVAVHAKFPAKVTEMLDTSADPCEDFEQYACGGWFKSFQLPDDKPQFDFSFTGIADRNTATLQKIFESGNKPILRDMYRSCMDVDKLNELGGAPLKANLDRINGAQSKAELFRLVGQIGRSTAMSVAVGASVTIDRKKATDNIVEINPMSFTLPDQSYYQDDKTWEKMSSPLTEYVSQVLSVAGMNGTDTQKLVVSMEKELADLLPPKQELMDPFKSYNSMSVGDAQSRYPVTVGNILQGLGLTQKLRNDSTLTVRSPTFAEKAEQWVAKTDLKNLQTFVAYTYANKMSRYLGEPMISARYTLFDQTLSGSKNPLPRAETCVRMVMDSFPELAGVEYVNEMYDQERQETAELLMKHIEEAMKKNIAALEWLDDATKQRAQEKLDKVANLIGYAKNTVDYSSVNFTSDSLVGNMENVITLFSERFTNRIGQKVDRMQWSMTAGEVNAYYNAQENKMVFPAGILQSPFMTSKAHPVQNFGAIGAVIGHELTHGFDSSGRMYDGDGTLSMWWSNETNKNFEERAQCLADQYSGFVLIGDDGKTELGKIYGNLTLGENIADNGGVKLAWDAYHAYMNGTKTNRTNSKCKVKSSNSTDANIGSLTAEEVDKLFFISYGQAYCSKSRDAAMQNQLKTDVHSPNRWRINGVAMNNREFAKVFQCAAGTKMNPEKKCELW